MQNQNEEKKDRNISFNLYDMIYYETLVPEESKALTARQLARIKGRTRHE